MTEPANDPTKPPTRSLQFFNKTGEAVHKIFPREATDLDVLDSVIAQYAEPSAAYVFTKAVDSTPPAADDSAIDAAGLGDAWAAMQDTHEFFGLLKDFSVARQQSFRLMQGRFTEAAQTSAIGDLLKEAAFVAHMCHRGQQGVYPDSHRPHQTGGI